MHFLWNCKSLRSAILIASRNSDFIEFLGKIKIQNTKYVKLRIEAFVALAAYGRLWSRHFVVVVSRSNSSRALFGGRKAPCQKVSRNKFSELPTLDIAVYACPGENPKERHSQKLEIARRIMM